tara:strand:+ start:85 stop:735 length:651 start_codon:yes stop_codon:yes gene_type:complete
MASYKTKKNIHKKKLSLPEQKAELEQEADNLQIDIDRPQQFEYALRKETDFGAYYWSMTHDEKKWIQYQSCNHCRKFVGSDMEALASFFGMCACMWQRYVARTYRPRYIDPSDMNSYSKRERYKKLAQKAQAKMGVVQDKLAIIQDKIANNDNRRRYNENVKMDYALSDEEIKFRLEEREIQAEKNKIKMARARSVTTSPPVKHKRSRGRGKQNSV